MVKVRFRSRDMVKTLQNQDVRKFRLTVGGDNKLSIKFLKSSFEGDTHNTAKNCTCKDMYTQRKGVLELLEFHNY